DCLPDLDAYAHRRFISRRFQCATAATYRCQSRALVAIEPDRAGRNHLSDVRWKEDSDVGAEAAQLRPAQKISSYSEHPRRSSCGLRLDFRARISMDGGQRLPRALSEPARQHHLRPGVRK